MRISLSVLGVVSVCAGGAVARAQSLEMHVVTNPDAPNWAAVDFLQVLADSDDVWLLGQVTTAQAFGSTKFRLIGDVHPDDPNIAPYAVPDRDGNGVSLDEQFTTFLSETRRSPFAVGRFGFRAEPWALPQDDTAYTAKSLRKLLAADGGFGSHGGYWGRIAVELPDGVDPAQLYAAERTLESSHRVLARGTMTWGTDSTVAASSADPSWDTPWVLALNPDGPPAPIQHDPNDPNSVFAQTLSAEPGDGPDPAAPPSEPIDRPIGTQVVVSLDDDADDPPQPDPAADEPVQGADDDRPDPTPIAAGNNAADAELESDSFAPVAACGPSTLAAGLAVAALLLAPIRSRH